MRSTHLIVTALLALCAAQVFAVTYNPTAALLYLEYAKVSYCNEANIKAWNCGAPCNQLPGMVDVTAVNKPAHEGQGYAAYDSKNNNIVMAIRGSSNIQNWYNNLNFIQEPYAGCSGCQVHTGFFNTYSDVKGTLLNAYSQLNAKYGSKKPGVIVTGHSLGGVVAELLAVDVYKAGAKGLTLYTYGTPRLGNPQLSTYIHGLLPNAIRVTHYKDPVPHVPPQSGLGYTYLNVPTEVWYNTESGSSYKVCNMPGVQEDPSCSDSELNTNINDHLHYLGINTGCDPNNHIEREIETFIEQHPEVIEEQIKIELVEDEQPVIGKDTFLSKE